METQKTFSKFFQAGGCELQTGRCSTTQSLSPTFYSLAVVVMNFYFFMHEIESLCFHDLGVYESFDTIFIYLESDQAVGNDPNKNFRVRYRMAVVNQKKPTKTMWKESSICKKTWNNLVLQFMKVSDMLEADAGFLVRDTIVFVCEILDCCPWFKFLDLEVSPYGIACLCFILYVQLLLDRCQIFLSLAPFFYIFLLPSIG